MSDPRLYFRQLLGGRDFAVNHPFAGQMQNFVYLVGDRETHECMVVDPAWAVGDLLAEAAKDDMKVVGALVTHYHPDHVGGTFYGETIEGVAELVAANPCPIHVHEKESHGVRQVTRIEDSDMVKHISGDKVRVGDIEIELLHTPGHTPGSQCFRVKSSFVSGDTLFLQGCGRVDLPGGNPEEMYRTLTERLASIPSDAILFPGHAYGGDHADMGTVRRTNPYLQATDRAAWLRMRG
jgi:hydroxyacylglutathione hydrolase